MGNIDETSRRVCVTCSEEKPLSEFYKQSGKEESEIRWDKKCKVCKRNAINSARSKGQAVECLKQDSERRRGISNRTNASACSEGKTFRKNGRVHEFQKSEWESMVRVFQTLKRWRDERNAPKANTIESERTWPLIRLGDINKNAVLDLKRDLVI